MKIKSKFKDYYDFVANQYGGGDPKVVYVRDRIAPLVSTGYIHYDGGLKLDPRPNIHELPRRYMFKSTDDKWLYKWCIVAGKYYLLVADNTYGVPNYQLFTKDHPSAKILLSKRSYFNGKTIEYYIGSESEELIKLSREINAPVFNIRGTEWDWKSKKYTLVIDSNIPILSDLGFASIISAGNMYQDIAYFLGNKINISPDLMPEPNPEMTNKERILSHGFDIKSSFRHRM